MSKLLPLRVYVFNVGQGDNLLLHFPDGSYGLVDFFFSDPNAYENEPPSITFLKQAKKRGEDIKISFLHISHYHFDHVKGIDILFDWLRDSKNKKSIHVANIWLPGYGHTNSILNKIVNFFSSLEKVDEFIDNHPQMNERLQKLQSENYVTWFEKLEQFIKKCIKSDNVSIEYLNSIRIIPNPCKDVEAYVLAPKPDRAIKFAQQETETIIKQMLIEKHKNTNDGNDISSIISIHVGNIKLLLGGDAKKQSISESMVYIERSENLFGYKEVSFSADFIKIFHHGAKYSSDRVIWEKIIKDLKEIHIAISAGVNKKYDHPHKETFDDIEHASESIKCNIYSTNLDYLSKRGEHRLSNVDQIEYLDWPKLAEKSRAKSKEQELDRFNLGINTYNDETRFLGFCFEFDTNNKAITVKKLLVKN